MAVMPCAHGEFFVPCATKASVALFQNRQRCMPAHVWACGIAAACLLILSGCTFADQNATNGKAAPPAAATVAQQPTGPTPMDTFRALAPPEGMKFTPLFASPVKDEGQRFARLEQSVQALRNDFDTVTPTMVRLAAIEKDIRDLVTQLRTLDDAGPIVEAVPVAPVAVAPVTAMATPTKAPASAPVVVAPVAQAKPVPPTAPISPVPPASNVTAQIKPPQPEVISPKPAPALSHGLPGKDVTGGTEAAPATQAVAGKPAASLPVTPEAASTGQLPPEGAASPPSTQQVIVPAPKVVPSVPVSPAVAPAVQLPKAPPPLELTPVMPSAETAVVTPQPSIDATATPQPAAKIAMGPILGDVKAIRVGDHIDKTRIVLDVTTKAPFKVRLENEGRRLVVEMPQYAWQTDTAWKAMSAALVSGYQYADGALVIDLLAPAVIQQQVSLPASEGTGPRIIIDLFSALVHVK